MSLPSPAPSVVFQRLADGAVLFAPSTELYFGLNSVGADVWELLPPATGTLEELCDRVTAKFAGTDAAIIRQDVLDLLAQLQQEGLVIAPSTEGPGAAPTP